MTQLPDSYVSPLHLPFNRSALDGHFSFASPDRDPGGEGDWLVLSGSDLVLPAGSARLPSGPLPEPLQAALTDAHHPPLYLGHWQGRPCRLLSLSDEVELPAGWRSESLVGADPQLPIELLSLGGLGRQLRHWEKGSRYCSRCGSQLERLAGEWGKACGGCDYHHFPHIHPCIIVLVRRPGEVLLTRKAVWPEGRYSLVAGFLDTGECLEEAVAREVREETGVEVSNVRYIGSQSWPFPSQLMVGYLADYAGGELRVEEQELEDARWFPVDALPKLPPKRSIARYILDHHLRD